MEQPKNTFKVYLDDDSVKFIRYEDIINFDDGMPNLPLLELEDGTGYFIKEDRDTVLEKIQKSGVINPKLEKVIYQWRYDIMEIELKDIPEKYRDPWQTLEDEEDE